MEDVKILTAAELKKRSVRVVTLPDGSSVVIARLPPSRLMAAGGGLMDLAALAKDDVAKLSATDDPRRAAARESALAAIEKIVQAGVIEPALALERTPDGPPVAADFTLDEQFLLFSEILEFSGYTKKAAAAIRP